MKNVGFPSTSPDRDERRKACGGRLAVEGLRRKACGGRFAAEGLRRKACGGSLAAEVLRQKSPPARLPPQAVRRKAFVVPPSPPVARAVQDYVFFSGIYCINNCVWPVVGFSNKPPSIINCTRRRLKMSPAAATDRRRRPRPYTAQA